MMLRKAFLGLRYERRSLAEVFSTTAGAIQDMLIKEENIFGVVLSYALELQHKIRTQPPVNGTTTISAQAIELKEALTAKNRAIDDKELAELRCKGAYEVAEQIKNQMAVAKSAADARIAALEAEVARLSEAKVVVDNKEEMQATVREHRLTMHYSLIKQT
jgi:hypothetical protein